MTTYELRLTNYSVAQKTLAILLVVIFFAEVAFAATDDLYQYLLQGDYNRVIKAVNTTSATAEEYYLLGLAYLKKKDYAQARYNLDQAGKKAKNPDLKDKAALALSDTYLLEQKFPEAFVLYESLLKANARNGMTPLLLLRLAQCNIKQGKWEEGNSYLNKLRSEFPNSLEAQISESLSSTNEFFCVQAGSFTRYDNAQEFAEKLKSQGFDAYVSGVQVEDKTLYRVRVGECDSRQEAEGLKENLDSRGYDTKIYP